MLAIYITIMYSITCKGDTLLLNYKGWYKIMTNQINRLTRILERNDKAEMEYNRATEELRDFLHELYLDEINNEERAQAITNLNQLAQKAQELALKVYEEARNLETTLISETIDEQLS